MSGSIYYDPTSNRVAMSSSNTAHDHVIDVHKHGIRGSELSVSGLDKVCTFEELIAAVRMLWEEKNGS